MDSQACLQRTGCPGPPARPSPPATSPTGSLEVLPPGTQTPAHPHSECRQGRPADSPPLPKARGLFSPNTLLLGKSLFFFFLLFWAAPAACGASQARALIGATAASLHHSHSSAGSEPHLRPTPQPTATPEPQPTERGQGSNPHPHRDNTGSSPMLSHDRNPLAKVLGSTRWRKRPTFLRVIYKP